MTADDQHVGQDLDAGEVVEQHAAWTMSWHEGTTPSRTDAPWTHIEANHRMNFDLWHEEDVARRDDLGSQRVHEAKRSIDAFNQARNDAMERIDDWVLSELAAPADDLAPLHTETPGMIIDRLSILSLKSFHMERESHRENASDEHRGRCAARHAVIEEQLADLASGLAVLLHQLAAGSRRFKVYRQFKMYNDPALNPQLHSPAAHG